MSQVHRAPSRQSINRDSWIEVNLRAIEENYRSLRQLLAAEVKFCAVLKSDAYGHGASVVAPVLEAAGVDYFAVASLDEGVQLREAGITVPVLVLTFPPTRSLTKAQEYDLELTVTALAQLEALASLVEAGGSFKLQIELNTGMNRSGITSLSEAFRLFSAIREAPELYTLTGVFSHLATAGQEAFAAEQLALFHRFQEAIPPEQLGIRHLAASGALADRRFQFDMVRCGLGLFGLGEAPEGVALKPALSVKARLIQLQQLSAGEGVGYDLTWLAGGESRIGLIPLGYADGFVRGLSGRVFALCRGKLIPQVGRISMDLASFDLSACLEAELGDTVTLIGGESGHAELTVRHWAELTGTIEYEVCCALRGRLPRVFTR